MRRRSRSGEGEREREREREARMRAQVVAPVIRAHKPPKAASVGAEPEIYFNAYFRNLRLSSAILPGGFVAHLGYYSMITGENAGVLAK